MKLIFNTKLIIIMAISLALFSCNKAPQTVEEKKKELSNLKIQLNEIEQKIKLIEKDLIHSKNEVIPISVMAKTIQADTFKRYISAVSYTHLDVYKRQVF